MSIFDFFSKKTIIKEQTNTKQTAAEANIKARRQLIGVVVLIVIAVLLFSLIFEGEPRQANTQISKQQNSDLNENIADIHTDSLNLESVVGADTQVNQEEDKQQLELLKDVFSTNTNADADSNTTQQHAINESIVNNSNHEQINQNVESVKLVDVDADKKAQLAKEQAAKVAKAKQEQLAKEQAAKIAKAKQEQLAKEQAAKIAKAKQEQLAKEQVAKIAKAKQEQLAKQQAAKIARAKQEQLAKEQAAKIAKAKQEQLAKEQAAKIVKAKQEQLAKEQAVKIARAKKEQLAKEQAAKIAKAKQEQLAKEQAVKIARAKKEQLAKEQAAKIAKAKKEQLAKDQVMKIAKAKQEQLAKEQAQRANQILNAKNNTSVKYIVQIGAYSDPNKVAEVQKKIKTQGVATFVQKINIENGVVARVRSGPYNSQIQAQSVVTKLSSLGYKPQILKQP